MTKRILLIFCLLAAMILPAAAATKTHRSKSAGKHSVARSRKTKAKTKSVRKATHRRTRSVKRAARRQRLARK
jgi:hypothetical protein